MKATTRHIWLLFFIGVLAFFSCTQEEYIIVNPPEKKNEGNSQSTEELLGRLKDADGREVMVVAHRAAWNNSAENSLEAIQAAIDMGVDIVELDIRITSDGHPILMHDATIDRTTSGTGEVSKMTLEEIRKVFLKNSKGIITDQRVPLLAEALEMAKGKILIRIDKAYEYFDKVTKAAISTGTEDHLIFIVPKEYMPGNVAFKWESTLEQYYFSPTIDADAQAGITQANGYENFDKVVALETSFASDEGLKVDFFDLRKRGFRVMVYTGSPGSSGGHDDELAKRNIDLAYGWLIDQGVNMIQTDEPELLLNYLRIRGLHP